MLDTFSKIQSVIAIFSNEDCEEEFDINQLRDNKIT